MSVKLTRPTTKLGSLVSTPSAKFANELLGGGLVYQGVQLTQSEVDRLRRLYKYEVERPNDQKDALALAKEIEEMYLTPGAE